MFLDLTFKCFSLANPPVGAEALIKQVQSLGIPSAIATGSAFSSYQQKISKKRHLFDCMSHAVCSDDPDVKEGKPAPYIYQVAATRFQNPPSSNSNVGITGEWGI